MADGMTKALYLHHQGEFQHNYCAVVSLHDSDHVLVMKKDTMYVGGIVYITVMFDHPSLVSLLFAVLVSLHPVTFSMFFITSSCKFFSSRHIHL